MNKELSLEAKVLQFQKRLEEINDIYLDNEYSYTDILNEYKNLFKKEVPDKVLLMDVNLMPNIKEGKQFDIDKFLQLAKEQKITLVSIKPSLEETVEVLCNALREDKNKELFYKCFDEEYKLQFNSKPIIHSKEIALEAAKNFLNLLISK